MTGNALNRKLCEEEGISGIVTGFTASEILTAFAVLLKKFPEGNPFFVNAYPRVVTEEGSIPGHYVSISDYNKKTKKYLLLDSNYLPKRATSAFGDWIGVNRLLSGALESQYFYFFKSSEL